MKIKILLIFLVGIIFLSCKSKLTQETNVQTEVNYIPYYLKVYEADSLYIVKNYQRSYEILDSLFKIFEPIQMVNYYEVNNYFKLKILLNKKINLKEFSKLISKYRLTDITLKNDSIFNIYYLKEKSFFDKNYNNLRNEHLSKLKIDLRNEIKEMKIQDQFYRKKDYEANIDKQNKIDSINANKMIKLFDDFGYPNENVIGEFNIDNSFVDITAILLHTKDNDRLSYFMPQILDYVKDGKASPKTYASLRDQFNLYHGENQYYGSYENKISISLNDLNKRRKTIGLPNYGYEIWRFKQLYPKEEY